MQLYVDGIEQFADSGRAISNGGSGGGVATATLPPPTKFFDLSPLVGKRDSDKINGNTVGDIKSALEVYNTGYSSGRGYGYAQDVVRRFGATDIRAGAASYLQAAGLNFLADIVQPNNPQPPFNECPPSLAGSQSCGGNSPLLPDLNPVTPNNPNNPVTDNKNPFELLLDALPNLFGQQVYNPPLQSQTYGYSQQPTLDTSGNSSIGIYLIIGVIAVIGYFLYKRYA